MSKKPRTPDPPRKVQAPKARHRAPSDRPSLPWTNVLIGAGTVAVVGMVIALIIVLSGGSSSAENVAAEDVARVRTAMTAAGCTMQSSAADAANQHISEADQAVTYKTFPASSGPHSPGTAIWGNYRNPTDPRLAIHNLEHGGIAVWYGPDISDADRGALDAFYDDAPNGLLIAPLEDPYPGITYPEHEPLGSGIALTVWTADVGKPDSGQVHVAVCPRYDAAAFEAYRDAFLGKGPERFPVSQMLPGVN